MIKLLGVSIEELPRREVMAELEKAKGPLFIVTLNPEILLHAWHDERYQKILNEADIKVADGVGIVILSRLFYGVKLERFPGADLAGEIAKWAEKNGKKIFLLGGASEANKKALKKFKSAKGLGGAFTEAEAGKAIKEYRPDVLFVALGAPKQEFFIHQLLQASHLRQGFGGQASYKLQAILVGIGGTIDYWAYPSLRAPVIVRRIGLEWLWRVILEPWRIVRIVNAVILFPLACLWERLRLQ